MITYVYGCHHCKKEVEIQQSIKSPALITCPNCHQDTLERIISGGHLIIMNNINTLQKAAEANTKKMGHYELQEKRYEDTKKLKDSKRRSKETAIKKMTGQEVKLPENVESFLDKDTAKKIQSMTPEQTQKWVLDG